MESIDQIAALAFVGDQQIATQVAYQTCKRCGFRLKRIETTIICEQRLVVEHCSICEQFDNEHSNEINDVILSGDRFRQFDLWLGMHGLDRETLEVHYHLTAENFFDKIY